MNQQIEIIKFNNVELGYSAKPVLSNLNLSICKNDFIGVVGPNGAGKTTLLKGILGNLSPRKGEIWHSNVRFGYVPQRDLIHTLLPYSVFDVVMMGRYSAKGIFSRISEEDIKIVNECLHHVGIFDLKNSTYKSISGGQRQRTLIARALAVKPNVLILDEPTNGMDTPSHYSLLDLISRLHNENQFTVILVSHLLSDVANVVKKIILIEKDNFQYGNISDILSEGNLNKIYSSSFKVTKIEGEYLITLRERK